MKKNLHRSFILLIIFTMSFSMHVTAETIDTYEDPADEIEETENDAEIPEPTEDRPEELTEEESQQINAEEADTENLSEALNEAQQIDTAQISDELQSAMEEAYTLIESDATTQDEIDATTERLNQSIKDALTETEQQEVVNKAILWTTIEEATSALNELNEENATAFIDVLTDANIVFDDQNATQEEVDAVQLALEQAIDDTSDFDGEREVQVIDDLITIVTEGSYDQNEVMQMIENMQKMHPNLYQGLIDNRVNMYLINFPITELEAFEHLAGEVPRGWEDTGNTWDDVPGAGGQNSVARIGYSSPGNGHGSLNLELHEIAHPIDTIVLDGISGSEEFLKIHAEEQPRFLPDVYFEDHEEYFAEAFSYYFLSDELRGALAEGAPRTYKFIENLAEENITPPDTEVPPEAPEEESDTEQDSEEESALRASKDELNERIEDAIIQIEENPTQQLENALNKAIAISEDPEASIEEVNTALEGLSSATAENQSDMESDDGTGDEAEEGTVEIRDPVNTNWETVTDKKGTDEITAGSIVNGSLLPSTATNTANYLLIGTLLILIGSIIIASRKLFTKGT